MLLWLGVLVLIAGIAVILTLVLADPEKAAKKADAKEQKKKEDAALKELYASITKSLEKKGEEAEEDGKKRKGAFAPERLAFAEIEASPGSLVVWITVASFMGAIVGFFILGSFFLGLLLTMLPYFGFRFKVRRRIKKKQKAFASQLGQALQVISSTLQAGQSLSIAFTAVAEEADEPIKSEMARILNETRLGRDLVTSLNDCAERMESEDFEWFTSAVALQRRTGGNLVEIIETVAETIRERFELRQKIRAYSAEGRASAYILMSLPVVIGLVFTLLNPDYMDPLFSSTIGLILLGASAIMYAIGYFWMSKIVVVKL